MQQIDELNTLKRERNNIDKFLSRFLEQFEMKMDYEETNSPYWRVYKDKINQRAILSDQIKTIEWRVRRG
jgi:hypothetical protein